MTATIETWHGTVTISEPYFSMIRYKRVISLTLTKPENNGNGYGISKEFDEDFELSRAAIERFAMEASELL